MKKIITFAVILLSLTACGYTEEEKLQNKVNREDYAKKKLLIKEARKKELGVDRIWCEDLCYDSFYGNHDMACTINCVNALKSGKQLINISSK